MINKRYEWESSWIQHSCAGLSKDSIDKKLEQVRKNRNIDDALLKQIYDTNKDVLSKTAEIDALDGELHSMQLRLDKLDTTLQQQIADKNAHLDQVHRTTH